MPASSSSVFVVSQNELVRELLAQCLKMRCGAAVVNCLATLRDVAAQASRARIVVCDPTGVAPEDWTRFVNLMKREHPLVTVLSVTGPGGAVDLERVCAAVKPRPSAVEPHAQLTPPEVEVMLAVAAGQRNSEIARRLRRSAKTVEKHRASALRKLGFRSVAQLTAYAVQHQLLDADDILTRNRR